VAWPHGPGHFLRDKVEDPARLKALAENEPSEALRLLLASFGRSLTVQEVRDNFSGLVDESRWTSFWTAA
jgi:transcription elongation factor GreA-like protein